jgi:hypothetical protein
VVWSRKVKTVSSQNWYITDVAYLYWIPIQYLHVCRHPHLHNTVRYCSTLWTPTSKTRNYTCAFTTYIVLKVTDSLTGSKSCITYHILHFNCLCQFLYHFSTQKMYQDKFFKNPCHRYVMFKEMAAWILKRYHVRFTPLPCYYSAPHTKQCIHLHDHPPYWISPFALQTFC